MDSYHNLLFKALSWMHWITSNCAQVPWIVKTDDDILVDIFGLQKYLEEQSQLLLEQEKTVPTYHCLLWRRMLIMRDEKSKWYIWDIC